MVGEISRCLQRGSDWVEWPAALFFIQDLAGAGSGVGGGGLLQKLLPEPFGRERAQEAKEGGAAVAKERSRRDDARPASSSEYAIQ